MEDDHDPAGNGPQMLEKLWGVSLPDLLRFARHVVVPGVAADAEDLVSDAYLLLAKEAHTFTNEQALRVKAFQKIGQAAWKVSREKKRDKQVDISSIDLLVDHSNYQIDVLDLERALEELEKRDSRSAQIVELRFFAGLNSREIADALGISMATIAREWSVAKKFLASRIPASQTSKPSIEMNLESPGDANTSLEQTFQGIVELNLVSPGLLAAIQQDPRILGTLDWREFEYLLAEILARLNYEVELQRGTKDGGIDIFAIKRDDPLGPHRYLLQAKRSRNSIGINPVRELLFLHQHHRMTRSCLATTSMFTRGAWRLAGEYPWQLELKDAEKLREWITLAVKKAK